MNSDIKKGADAVAPASHRALGPRVSRLAP